MLTSVLGWFSDETESNFTEPPRSLGITSITVITSGWIVGIQASVYLVIHLEYAAPLKLYSDKHLLKPFFSVQVGYGGNAWAWQDLLNASR